LNVAKRKKRKRSPSDRFLGVMCCRFTQ
jgi:hypothetical protein